MCCCWDCVHPVWGQQLPVHAMLSIFLVWHRRPGKLALLSEHIHTHTHEPCSTGPRIQGQYTWTWAHLSSYWSSGCTLWAGPGCLTFPNPMLCNREPLSDEKHLPMLTLSWLRLTAKQSRQRRREWVGITLSLPCQWTLPHLALLCGFWESDARFQAHLASALPTNWAVSPAPRLISFDGKII